MSTQDHNSDLVGAYVLHALAPDEHQAFAAHLEECSACRAEVAELRQVVDVLPLSSDLVEPPTTVRDRIVAAVAAEAPGRPPLTSMVGSAPLARPLRRRDWREAVRRGRAVLAVAAAAAIVALGVWNVRLQQRVHDQDQAIRAAEATQKFQREVAAAIASGASVSHVSGTAAAPGASAAMVQPANGKTAYLIVKGLRPTPASKVYQIWLVRGTTPRSAQVFRYGGVNPEIVRLPVATTGWPRTAVTLEPGPRGSRGPTTSPVLFGKLAA